MKLFGHPDSGHAYKIRFFLVAHSLAHDYEVVDIFSPRNKRQMQFQLHARYGEVPLLLHQDKAYVQSNAILLHLATTFNIGLGDADSQLAQCREWLAWEANKIGMCLPQLRSLQRFDDNQELKQAEPWLINRYKHDVFIIEQTLADDRLWLLKGNLPSIADFSVCAYLFLADEAKVEVPARTQAWLQRLRALPGWQHPYQLLA